MSKVRVVLGFQGVQMPANAIRGIGRWSSEYAMALIHYCPGLVTAISVDTTLPVPALVGRLPNAVAILHGNEKPDDNRDDDRVIFHVLSPLEDLPIERIWPTWARDPAVGLVTTLFDMIPLLFPADYFRGALKRLLSVRYELHRQADATIGISRTTVDDAVRLLGIEPARAFVAGGGVSSRFRPPVGSRADVGALLEAIGVRAGFVLTIGNVDPRKNLPALIEAYAMIPKRVRCRHQLVITCSQGDAEHVNWLHALAANAGVYDDVVILPFVSDDTMVTMYQSCELMIYPSLYEGLGLPLLEAMACGAAVLASDVGPMSEIVGVPQALFDPSNAEAIASCLGAALNDDELLGSLRSEAVSRAAAYNWQTSTVEARAAYERAAWRA